MKTRKLSFQLLEDKLPFDKALLLQRDDLKSSPFSVENDIKNTFPEYKVLREIRIGILSDISLILELQSQL